MHGSSRPEHARTPSFFVHTAQIRPRVATRCLASQPDNPPTGHLPATYRPRLPFTQNAPGEVEGAPGREAGRP